MIDVYYTLQPPCLELQQGGKQSASRLVCYKGVPVYVQPYDENRWQITGLCSTNPAHFLRADLKPGAFIPLFQQTK